MRLVLIRHFQTEGNTKGRYIGGRTDESILPIRIHREKYPVVDVVYSSPMKRCLETSALIYPEKDAIRWEGFRECDFGRFENKNYLELSDDESYQSWIDSGGMMAFPEGEDPIEFRARSTQAFLALCEECMRKQITSVAIIVHGGTIMSILEKLTKEPLSFYDYMVKNGEGYVISLDELEWRKGNKYVEIERSL